MPRAYNLLVRERGRLTPEQAIRKMSGLAADKLGLTGKGRVEEGRDADFLLIQLDSFRDRADYQHGAALCEGIKEVYVGGKPVYRSGETFPLS